MKFCQNCGKELSEDAEVCLGCGCTVNKVDDSTPVETPRNVNKKEKIKRIWIILGAVVLALGIIAAVLFVPRNLKMDDFKKTNVVTAIMKYGLPESIDSDEDSGVFLRYDDKLDFYGITPWSCIVYPEEDKVVFFFREDDSYDVYKKITRYCELEDVGLGIFHYFSYEDIEITTYDYDGSYVSIELN